MVEGTTYYLQVGVFDAAYVGSVNLTYTIPTTPIHPTEVTVIPECPIEIDARTAGRHSNYVAPNGGELGVFHDGYVEWFEPGHVPGELLLWIGIGDYLGQSAPAGYTEVFNGQWDNAQTDDPSPRGAMAASHYPVNSQFVSLIVAYRIADDTLSTADADTTVQGTYSGLTYSEHGYALWMAATGGDGNNGFGVRVYSFRQLRMFGDFEQVNEWIDNPVKVGNIADSAYHRVLASDQESPWGLSLIHI